MKRARGERLNGLSKIQAEDLVARVCEQLTQAIVSGQIAPGEHLVEAEVARRMGISRAPVREAARLLEQRGLLESLPRRGFFVRSITLEELDDLYGLRINLECYAAELLIERATDEDMARLEQQADLMRDLARRGEKAALAEEDLRFHLLVCELSRNRRLIRIFNDLNNEIRMVIALIGQLHPSLEKLAEAHVPLLEVLKERNLERAKAEIDYHIDVAWRTVRAFFEEKIIGSNADNKETRK